MLHRFWSDVGIIERYLHQPYSEVMKLTAREFTFHVLTACFWRWKEIDAAGETEET